MYICSAWQGLSLGCFHSAFPSPQICGSMAPPALASPGPLPVSFCPCPTLDFCLPPLLSPLLLAAPLPPLFSPSAPPPASTPELTTPSYNPRTHLPTYYCLSMRLHSKTVAIVSVARLQALTTFCCHGSHAVKVWYTGCQTQHIKQACHLYTGSALQNIIASAALWIYTTASL